MKLIHMGYNLEISLEENRVTVISVENPNAYANILGDFWRQIHGEEGKIILSENGKIKNISKEMDCIFNPFSLDCNDKKIINKLYQELKEQANTMLVNESTVLNAAIVGYLDKLIMQVPYALEYNLEFDILNLLKIFGVKVEVSGSDLLERIVEYMQVLNRICGTRLYVFVGLKQYLTNRDLLQLYEFVFYEKIYLIIVEATCVEYIEGEKHWILDKDLCIIEV